MGNSIKDALTQAFKKSGQSIPVSKSESTKSQEAGSALKVKKSTNTPGLPHTGAIKRRNTGRHGVHKHARAIRPGKESVPQTSKTAGEQKPKSASSSPSPIVASPAAVVDPVKSPPLPPPEYKLKVGTNAAISIELQKLPQPFSLLEFGNKLIGNPHTESLTDSDDTRELIVGLDFGTSSVKVVIGDRAADRAYAVPFLDCSGIDRYMLPSRLSENEGVFSLGDANICHRDLKLSLLMGGCTAEAETRVVAFLALIIRHSLSWLRSEKAQVYARTKILWKLVIGIPSKNIGVTEYRESELVNKFIQLSRAAWSLAEQSDIAITKSHSESALKAVTDAFELLPSKDADSDVEIEVVPELSAQIYGFLRSNQFDRGGRNLFVVVDVGAGTVDSALFKVETIKGRWNFQFFTNHVEPLGVMNLHRYRVDWWASALSKLDGVDKLTYDLKSTEFPTDRMLPLPNSITEYFSDTELNFREQKTDPDWMFFMLKVIALVRGKTIHRAVTEQYLDGAQLNGVPLFLCGGGSRMQFYRRIRDEMKCFEGVTWLKAVPRDLQLPKDLEAPGVPGEDYDRLSVAYGLSFLDVGKIAQAMPAPIVSTPPQPTWSFDSRYVDKDQV